MTDFQTKTITIEGFEMKSVKGGQMYKITDQDNTKYTFFTTKQDKTDTQVYKQWKDMQLGQGSTVQISFVEETFYSEKAGKDIKTKKAVGFREAPQTSAPAPQSVQDDYGRRLAIHGFVNSRLTHKEIAQVIQEIPYLLQLEDKIIEALNGKEKTINVDEDLFISDEEVPF